MTTAVEKDEQVIEDAKMIWQYCKHHKNSTIRWADVFQYVLKQEKIKLSPARQKHAMEYLVEQNMLSEIVSGSAWRVQKIASKHSKQHQETLDALRSSVHDEEEIKTPTSVEETKLTLTPVEKREIRLSEESTILAQGLDYVKEFPRCVSSDLVAYFGISSNRATMMLKALYDRKVVKRYQEEREIGISKTGKPIRRKIWVYEPMEPMRNLVGPQTLPKPQRRADDQRTNVRVTIAFTAASASIATMFYSYIKANGGADLSMEVKDA